MYTIYHIPQIKIGCTEQLPSKRVRSQLYKDFEILEVHTDIYVASDREIALQKQYGLPVDEIPYWKMRERFTPEIVKAAASKGAKKMHLKTRESGHMVRQANAIASLGNKASAKVRAVLTKEQVDSIKKEYVRGSKEYGQIALAKKYGVSQDPIKRIIAGTFTNFKT